MSKLWDFYKEDMPDNDDSDASRLYAQPEAILSEYANKVFADTDQQFAAVVTERSGGEDNNIFYSLFIFSPRLKDYRYRLIELNVPSALQPYPTQVTLFAKEPSNNQTFVCADAKILRGTLIELITSPLTKMLLSHLKAMIEIKEHYAIREESFQLSKENRFINFKNVRQPITIFKVVLKSHLGKEPNAWGRIFALTTLIVECKSADGFSFSQPFNLVSFMSLYQRQPVLPMRLILPPFDIYKQYENTGIEMTIRLDTTSEEDIELEVFYDDNLPGSSGKR